VEWENWDFDLVLGTPPMPRDVDSLYVMSAPF
jgi:hypothetical protein